MKKYTKQYLLFTFILGYLFFGLLVYQQIGFLDIFKNPLSLLFLIAGSLSPFFASILSYNLNKEDLKASEGFFSDFKRTKSNKTLFFLFLYFFAHYFFGFTFKNIIFYEGFKRYLIYIPIIGLIFASQEKGWRKFVQESYEDEKGYSKSVVISGLFWSLWFLPLIFVRGFIIMPQFFVQFAIYLIGINFLTSSLYKLGESSLYSAGLQGLIFGFAPLLIFKQNYYLLAITVLEAFIAFSLKGKKFK